MHVIYHRMVLKSWFRLYHFHRCACFLSMLPIVLFPDLGYNRVHIVMKQCSYSWTFYFFLIVKLCFLFFLCVSMSISPTNHQILPQLCISPIYKCKNISTPWKKLPQVFTKLDWLISSFAAALILISFFTIMLIVLFPFFYFGFPVSCTPVLILQP